MFAFVCWFCCFFSFLFRFLFWQNIISSSKDTDTTTAAVELTIRTIIVLLLLTWKIAYNSRKLSVQRIFTEQFFDSTPKDFTYWSWIRLVMKLSKLFSVNHKNNQLIKISMRQIHFKLTIKTPT